MDLIVTVSAVLPPKRRCIPHAHLWRTSTGSPGHLDHDEVLVGVLTAFDAERASEGLAQRPHHASGASELPPGTLADA